MQEKNIPPVSLMLYKGFIGFYTRVYCYKDSGWALKHNSRLNSLSIAGFFLYYLYVGYKKDSSLFSIHSLTDY